jgi:hypothetical protein
MQQIIGKIFQIRDADTAVAAVPFVQLFGLEMAAVRRGDFLPWMIVWWLVAGCWWRVGARSWLRVLFVDLGNAAAKIG